MLAMGKMFSPVEETMREDQEHDEPIDLGAASELTQGDPLDWAMEEIGGLHFKE